MPHPTSAPAEPWTLDGVCGAEGNRVWVWFRSPDWHGPACYDGHLTATGIVLDGEAPAAARCPAAAALLGDLERIEQLLRHRAAVIRSVGTPGEPPAIRSGEQCDLLADICALPNPAARATALAMLTAGTEAAPGAVLAAATSAAA